MVLGLFSDVHGNVTALEAVLAELRRHGADTLLCLGDLVGYGPSPNETIDLIREANVMCTLGAADERIAFDFARRRAPREGVADQTIEWTRGILDERHVAFLRSLPVQQRLDTPAGRLRFFHGTAEDPAARTDLHVDPIRLNRLLERHRCRLLACGGSHVPYYRRAPAGWVLNPGSVGLSLNGEPGADCALVRFEGEEAEVSMRKVDYDVAAVAFEIVAWGLPAVVAQAVQMGRMPTGREAGGEPRPAAGDADEDEDELV